MARTTENICLTLPGPLLKALEAAAQAQDRPRSYIVRKLLERSLTGQDRLTALEEVAAAGLEQYAAEHAPRVPVPNRVTSAEGNARIAEFTQIAERNKR